MVASGLAIATSTAFFTTTSSILDFALGGVAGGAEASGEDVNGMSPLEYLRGNGHKKLQVHRKGRGSLQEGGNGEDQEKERASAVAKHSVSVNA